MKNESNNSVTATENTPRKTAPELATGMNMRRKLMFGLLGGLLMQTIVPLNAFGATDKPAEDDVTEEMILEFLKNLYAVIQHDDLADIGFIERTLGVKAVLAESFVRPNGAKKNRYYLKEPKSRLLGQHMGREHEYSVTLPPHKEPTNENGVEKSKAEIRLVFSPSTQQRGIALEDLEGVFGKHQFYKEHISHVSPTKAFLHKEFGYRWQKQNDTKVSFLIDGESGFLLDVTLYQN